MINQEILGAIYEKFSKNPHYLQLEEYNNALKCMDNFLENYGLIADTKSFDTLEFNCTAISSYSELQGFFNGFICAYNFFKYLESPSCADYILNI